MPCAGFVGFVLRLEKGYYLYQFQQYAWTHLILLFVFIPSSFFVSNIFDGIIWFLLPCSLVIANDIFAYLAGAPALLLAQSLLISTPESSVLGLWDELVCTGKERHCIHGYAFIPDSPAARP